MIKLDNENTVESLRDQLQAVLHAGHDDTGFPILRKDKHDEGLRMVGYIGTNELEHALSTFRLFMSQPRAEMPVIGIVAEEASEHVRFHTTYAHDNGSFSVSSREPEHQNGIDPYDFSVYMDKVPFISQV